MTDRTWLPSDYLDEAIPPTRAAPSDWIIRLPGDAYALAPAFEPDEGGDASSDPEILRDGTVAMFSWTEKHGRATLFLNEDGTWEADGEMPAAPDGAEMMGVADDDIDTLGYDLGQIASCLRDQGFSGGEVEFYCWSTEPAPHVFRSGRFEPAPARPIRCGDHVFHRPSKETWVVAYVEGEDLSACGWPDGIAKLSDCRLAYLCTDEEHADLVARVIASGERRGAKVKALYGSAAA